MSPVESIERIKPTDIPVLVEKNIRISKYQQDAEKINDLIEQDQADGGCGLVRVVLTETNLKGANLYRSGVRTKIEKALTAEQSIYTRVVPDEEDGTRFMVFFSAVPFDQISQSPSAPNETRA